MRGAISRPDDGAALIMVLALLTVLSIALGAMFGNTGANLATSTLVSDQGRTFYTADGEVELVIQRLRFDMTTCSQAQPLPVVNHLQATVLCQAHPSLQNTFTITAQANAPGATATSTVAAVVTIGPSPDRRVIIRSWVAVRP